MNKDRSYDLLRTAMIKSLVFPETYQRAFLAGIEKLEHDDETNCQYLTIEGNFDIHKLNEHLPTTISGSTENPASILVKTVHDQAEDQNPFEACLIIENVDENTVLIDGRVNLTKIINALKDSNQNQ